MLRAQAIAGQRRPEPCIVCCEAGAISVRMPKVDDAGGEPTVLAAYSRTQQSDQQIGILASPAVETRVEPVDTLEVTTPDGEIAGARAAPSLLRELAKPPQGQPQHSPQTVDTSAQAMPEPLGATPHFGPLASAEHGGCELGREQRPVAGDEPAGFRQSAMDQKEVARRDAVAVQEDTVIAATREDGAIARLGGAKSPIVLPDMAKRYTQTRAPAFHHGCCRGAGAVVGDHDLEPAITLERQRRQCRLERVLAIVGGDDDRDEIRHVGLAPPLIQHVLARCDRAFCGRSGNRHIRNQGSPRRPILPSGSIRGKMQGISAYILAYNEAEKIAAAVASVLWVDEIVVADSGSTDDTAEIAERLGARIVQIPFHGFGDLRNRAIAECRYDWIFSLDSDERCTPEARDEILSIISSPATHDAYLVPRRNFMMGRWIKGSGWYPNFRQPQLFRKGALRYDTDPVHEGYELLTQRPLGRMRSAIWQFPFRNLGEVIRKMDRYSSLGAGKLSATRVSMAGALGHGVWAFVKHYLLKHGYRDGWAGFVIALGNFEGTFYRYAKRYEEMQAWSPPPSEPLRRP